jgi:formylglycine-generating enzyme required for sulfatase activity
MGNISQDLTIQGNQASGIIEVPAGEDRVFRAEAYIAAVIYYSGTSEPVDITAGTEITVQINMTDLTPYLQILEPSDPLTLADQNCIITWIDSDYDDNAQISLFYGPDTVFSNAIPIAEAQAISEDDPNNVFVWNTSQLDSGNVYYIFGRINDQLHPPEISRSPGSLLITHEPAANIAPTIQIIQPDGINDACDETYLITWIDFDPDNNASISLYYDSDNAGNDGTLIPGAINIPEDDESDAYNWNTESLLDSAQFYVYAIISDGVNSPVTSYSSGPVTINHSLSLQPPSAPTNLVTNVISTSEIDLSWNDNSNNETGFIIERHLESTTFQLLAQTSANQSTYADTGLTAATTYYYRVKAYNTAGESFYTNVAVGSTLHPTPQPPSGLQVTALSASSLQLVWDDNSNDELGFIIERRSGDFGAFSRIDSVEADTTTYIDEGLQPGSLYQYRICAYNQGGESAYSNISGAETFELLPVPPENLEATAQSAFSISLNWEDKSNNEDGFYIERSLSLPGPYTQIHTTNPNVQYYLDTSVQPETIYYYQVCAYNSAGQSNYTTPDSAQTLSADPAPPQNLTVIGVTSNSVSLEWDDMSTNEDGFIIERKIASADSFSAIHTNPANNNTYTDNQVYQLTDYQYRVKAYNIWGESGYSNVVNASTPQYSPFEMVSVPAGIFTMGNEPYGYGNEYHPGNPVYVESFEIMKYEVTNEQYANFLNEMFNAGMIIVYQGSVYSADTSVVYLALENSDCQIQFNGEIFYAETYYQDYPVTLTTWYGANAFAEFYEMSLPSEAQWEKAARGTLGNDNNGDGVGDGYKYPWGNTIDGSYANYNNSGDPWENGPSPYTSPVGAYDGSNYAGFQTQDNASVYGAYDLCGNALEWVDDWYGPYQNPHQPPVTGSYKVVRGGSWSSSTYFCRNAYRQYYDPSVHYNNLGFRCDRN